MTHSQLSRLCRRPAGWPESECPGEIQYVRRLVDFVYRPSPNREAVIEIDFMLCSACVRTLIVEGWIGTPVLRNEYPTSKGAIPCPS